LKEFTENTIPVGVAVILKCFRYVEIFLGLLPEWPHAGEDG